MKVSRITFNAIVKGTLTVICGGIMILFIFIMSLVYGSENAPAFYTIILLLFFSISVYFIYFNTSSFKFFHDLYYSIDFIEHEPKIYDPSLERYLYVEDSTMTKTMQSLKFEERLEELSKNYSESLYRDALRYSIEYVEFNIVDFSNKYFLTFDESKTAFYNLEKDGYVEVTDESTVYSLINPVNMYVFENHVQDFRKEENIIQDNSRLDDTYLKEEPKKSNEEKEMKESIEDKKSFKDYENLTVEEKEPKETRSNEIEDNYSSDDTPEIIDDVEDKRLFKDVDISSQKKTDKAKSTFEVKSKVSDYDELLKELAKNPIIQNNDEDLDEALRYVLNLKEWNAQNFILHFDFVFKKATIYFELFITLNILDNSYSLTHYYDNIDEIYEVINHARNKFPDVISKHNIERIEGEEELRQFVKELLLSDDYDYVEMDFAGNLIMLKNSIEFAITFLFSRQSIPVNKMETILMDISYINSPVKIVVTNQTFSKASISIAQRANVALWDKEDLINIVSKDKSM